MVVFDGGRMSRGFFWVLAGVAALVMGGCSAVPGTGPSAGAVIHNASVTSAANSTNSQADPLSYALVDINRDTVRRLSIPETFRGVFRSSQRAPAIYIGRGDRVDVTSTESTTAEPNVRCSRLAAASSSSRLSRGTVPVNACAAW